MAIVLQTTCILVWKRVIWVSLRIEMSKHLQEDLLFQKSRVLYRAFRIFSEPVASMSCSCGLS